MKIYGILVVYYEKYYEKSILEFQKLLRCISDRYELIIVSNNKSISLKGFIFHYCENEKSEFSAWDYGISKINNIDKDDILILANDTFCQHRPWGGVERNLFSKTFSRNLRKNFSGIAGHINSYNHPYEIIGFSSNRWVSTYLFSLSGDAVIFLKNRLTLTENQLINIFKNVDGNNIYWGSAVNNVFKYNIANWLSPDNKNGWYKKNISDEEKKTKLSAISNELYLSAVLISNGFEVKDIFSQIGLIKYIIIKIRRRLYRINIL